MVVLGALLLALAAVLIIGIVPSSTTPIDVQAFGTGLEGVSAGELFVLGACTGALAVVGFGLMLGGLARSRARRRSAKHEVREVRNERESLAEENARLQAELEQRQRDAAVYPTDATTAHPTEPAVRRDVDLPAPTGERGRHRTGR